MANEQPLSALKSNGLGRQARGGHCIREKKAAAAVSTARRFVEWTGQDKQVASGGKRSRERRRPMPEAQLLKLGARDTMEFFLSLFGGGYPEYEWVGISVGIVALELIVVAVV